ncbi:type II toxin-antitoxin system HicA family toxin [Lacticaseibacillus yichunensis]|uniref:Type II toxin-antitoxin system HicA family toxin n=1 Tax=Lacticaseibacillus yichunensis TaxID=2486015 RepID=A0ABW4CKN0_9LACO|nr:type II toxin-antitoxin system HicA family toxin [Lacticaseibacillus yichunensis]
MVQHQAKDVLQLLKANGFKELKNRQRGDPHRYTDGKGHMITVPYSQLKDNLAPKTYDMILAQAGLK